MSESVSAIDTVSVNIGSAFAKFTLIGGTSAVAGGGLDYVARGAEEKVSYLQDNYIGVLTYDESLRVMAAVCVFCNLVLFGIRVFKWLSTKFNELHDKIHAASIRRKNKRK